MPLLGKGVLAIWRGVTPEAGEDARRWHTTEHIPERVGVPGFLRGRRWANVGRPHYYVDFYETDTVDTIRSGPYLARLNEPTSWTRRVLPHFRDTFRIGCRVVTSVGRGQSGAMLTVRLRPAAGRADELRAWLTGPGLALLREPAGVVGVHVLETVPETTRIATAEGKLKGGELSVAEDPWPCVVLVECCDTATAEELARGPLAPDRLAPHGAEREGLYDVLRLEVSIDPE